MRNVTNTVLRLNGKYEGGYVSRNAISLKQKLRENKPLACLGVFDSLTALVAEQAGFEVAFVSGSAVAYSQLARPDIGLITLTEMAFALDRIRDRVDIDLFVDADSGFGSAFNVQRTVRTLERAGASGIQLEDQENTKRADLVTARPVIAKGAMVGKIKAALDARQNSETLISARTDSMYTLGLDESLERADAFLDAGADMVFVEGLTDQSDIRLVGDLCKGRAPVLYNMLDPTRFSMHELNTLGISMVLYPSVLIESVAQSAVQAAAELANSLSINGGATIKSQTIKTLIGADEYLERGYEYRR